MRTVKITKLTDSKLIIRGSVYEGKTSFNVTIDDSEYETLLRSVERKTITMEAVQGDLKVTKVAIEDKAISLHFEDNITVNTKEHFEKLEDEFKSVAFIPDNVKIQEAPPMTEAGVNILNQKTLQPTNTPERKSRRSRNK